MIVIYHNPRCSKSRETLALVEDISATQGLDLSVVDYQKTPLTLAQLRDLQQQLHLPVSAMLRTNEDDYTALNLAQADEAQLLAALVSHPKLLQRPVVSYRGNAAIGRPPALVLSLFQEQTKVIS
ncbi:arsenate reductase (glutaredoxin) [soil metagenome]